jgi:glycine/D-amino acid oxidase-like deaminating enzyme
MFDMAVTGVQLLRKSSPELSKLVQIVSKTSQNPSLEDLRISNSKGAIVQTNAASLWPYKLVAWILENLLATKSLNLQTNTPVTSIQKVGGGWIVHTSRGMISAAKVLLCTNAYTSALLPKFSDLIVPVRGEMSSLIPPASVQSANTTHQPLEHSYVFRGHLGQNIEQDDYLVQRPFSETSSQTRGGELMFGMLLWGISLLIE